jgi:hypothetical protein
MLDLWGNEIRPQGAQYLADALQSNTVSHVLSTSITYLPSSFNIDTYQAES